jgi:hypothetical protein
VWICIRGRGQTAARKGEALADERLMFAGPHAEAKKRGSRNNRLVDEPAADAHRQVLGRVEGGSRHIMQMLVLVERDWFP